MRERPDGLDSGDDRVYFFFTEVSVEYEFVFKLMIPRVARVCKVSPGPVPPPCAPAGSPRPGCSRVWRPRRLARLEAPFGMSVCPPLAFRAADGCGRAAPCSACPGEARGSPCRPQECQQACV